MKNPFTKGLAIVAVSSLLFAQIAHAIVSDETQNNDPYTDDPQISITISGSINSDGKAELSWTKYEGGDLKWYKVVHSTTEESPYYPVHGYIAVYSDAETTTHLHKSVAEGTNYYRVCVITDSNKRGCSNTLTLNNDAEAQAYVKTTADASFPDVETHWAKEYINKLYDKGVVEGRDGYFEPDNPVLRSEAVKMVLIGLGFEPVACENSLFPDLKDGDWFCGIVTKAYILGVIEGENGYLLPAKNISRAEALKVLLSTKGFTPKEVTSTPFSDVQPSDWYAGYVVKAKNLGWVEGIDGKFEPNRSITRAELSKLVSLALK